MSETDGAAARPQGRLSKALTGLFMKRATVVAIEDVAERFRLLTLEGEAFRGVAWSPGQKVQIAMGSAFMARTYTPIDFDPDAGRTRILGYVHGAGPGSAWLSALGVGNECDVFGPRSSLDVGRATVPIAAFGDETSIGIACSLAKAHGADAARFCFEVNDVDVCRRVVARLGLDGAALIAKREDERHFDALEAELAVLTASHASFLLTGKAGTIQRLRHMLKRRGVPAARILTKAYWASGKRGLD